MRGERASPVSCLWYPQVSYNKDLQIATHTAKRLMLMAKAPPEFIAVAREAIGKVKTMAETGLKKEILESAEIYPHHKFTKSAHNLFGPFCTTTDASSLMALTMLLCQKGRCKDMAPSEYINSCKAVAFFLHTKDTTFKRKGICQDIVNVIQDRVLTGKYDADTVRLAREFEEDTSETDAALFDAYLCDAMPMVGDAVRMNAERAEEETIAEATSAACPAKKSSAPSEKLLSKL